jgi:hypothetical protein
MAVRIARGSTHSMPFFIMASYYGLFLTIHILCAITFIGAVFFEVLVIEPIEKRLPPELGCKLASEIPKQVRTFMPYVVALLFLTGGAMFWVHFSNRPDFVTSRFGILMMIKMTLAFAVLGVFMASLSAAKRGKMDVCRFRYTHRVVAVLMLGIVLLAKGMYYL